MVKRLPMLVNFGDGGLDLESRFDENTSRDTHIVAESVNVPVHVVVRDASRFYYGRIKHENGNGKISLALDNKYDLDRFQTFATEQELEAHLTKIGIKQNERLELIVETVNPGQGALNAAYGEEVFQAGEANLDLYLVTPTHSDQVKKALPKNLRKGYAPLCRGHGHAPTNINIPLQGKKLTFRTPVSKYDGLCRSSVLKKLNRQDCLFIDSVKDHGFLDYALIEAIIPKRPHVYVSATESMVNNIGHGSMWQLLKQSEVYIANINELELITNKKITDYKTLREAMLYVQAQMKKGSRVYVTANNKGAFVLNETREMYHHSLPAHEDPLDFGEEKRREGKRRNTSGCGDAFAAVVVSYEALRSNGKKKISTAEILRDAGVAGQIKADLSLTCCKEMATPQKIQDYLNRFRETREITRYEEAQDKFVRYTALV